MVTGGGSFIDYNVDSDHEAVYYYAIQSGFSKSDSLESKKNGYPGLWGDYSPVISVKAVPTNCINQNSADAILHPGNRYEFVSAGVGALGQWSAVQVKALIPFVPTVVGLMDNFLETLKGSLKTNTKAFTDFLKGIKEKFEKYKVMLEAIVTMITAIENLFSSTPRLLMLNVPIASGGVDNFVTRVKKAQRPAEGFSGKGGTTFGVVLVYGVSRNNPFAGFDASGSMYAKSMDEMADLVSKSIKLLMKIYSS
jgi:hypothetical protein